MPDYIIFGIVLLGTFVLAHFQGQNAGRRKAEIKAAKQIAEIKGKVADEAYEAESSMSPDQLVDAMLAWLRTGKPSAGANKDESGKN